MFFARTGKGGITDRTFRLSDWWIEMEHKVEHKVEQRSIDREITVRIVIERVRSGVYEEAAYVAVLWARTALFHCDFEPIDKVGKHYRRGATASETLNNGTMNVWKIPTIILYFSRSDSRQFSPSYPP